MRSAGCLCACVGRMCSRWCPQEGMSSQHLRSWHRARAEERSREGKFEVDGVWSTRGLVGRDERSGVYFCCTLKPLEGFMHGSGRSAVTFRAFPSGGAPWEPCHPGGLQKTRQAMLSVQNEPG